MQEWYYGSGDMHNPMLKIRYVESFSDVIKAKYKAALMGEDTTSIYFARINQVLKEVHRQICQQKNSYKKQKELRKYFGTQFCKKALKKKVCLDANHFLLLNIANVQKRVSRVKKVKKDFLIKEGFKRNFKNKFFSKNELNLLQMLSVLFAKEIIMQKIILKGKIKNLYI